MVGTILVVFFSLSLPEKDSWSRLLSVFSKDVKCLFIIQSYCFVDRYLHDKFYNPYFYVETDYIHFLNSVETILWD